MLIVTLWRELEVGLSAEITATSPTQAYPIPVTVTFKKGGSNHSVSDFASDFTTSFKPTEVNGLELWLDAADTNTVSLLPMCSIVE